MGAITISDIALLMGHESHLNNTLARSYSIMREFTLEHRGNYSGPRIRDTECVQSLCSEGGLTFGQCGMTRTPHLRLAGQTHRLARLVN